MADQVNPKLLGQGVFDCEPANNCLMPMGITSENVAKEFGVDRATQDALAASSHKKAAAAAALLQAEITPYDTIIKD